MTSELNTMHQIAMEFVDEARSAHQRGEERTARLFFEKAFRLEKVVALAAPMQETYRLTRSVFLRSAASLALDCGLDNEAIQLLQLALSSQPHPAIEPELEELLVKVNARETHQEAATTVTGRLVGADLPNHQIKLQISDSMHLIAVFVPKDNFTKIIKEYWDNTVIVHGVMRPDGSIYLRDIQQAA
ncbi:MAG: hypothetical protein H6573_35335 [Lewinellaceae bacterium]|nr:hypothetical protein [Phaeodactylibacter sp.]MCB9352719.1 hypothetical protein [Lewinellaceae bacterium]